MKTTLPAFILTLILATGCATLSDPALTPLQRAEIIAREDGDLIRAAVDIATTAGVQFGESDPARRAAVAGEMERVAAAVAALAGGVVEPDRLPKLLKLEEPYMAQVFSVIAPFYKAGFDRLKSATNDPAVIARVSGAWLQLIAAGVRDGAGRLK